MFEEVREEVHLAFLWCAVGEEVDFQAGELAAAVVLGAGEGLRGEALQVRDAGDGAGAGARGGADQGGVEVGDLGGEGVQVGGQVVQAFGGDGSGVAFGGQGAAQHAVGVGLDLRGGGVQSFQQARDVRFAPSDAQAGPQQRLSQAVQGVHVPELRAVRDLAGADDECQGGEQGVLHGGAQSGGGREARRVGIQKCQELGAGVAPCGRDERLPVHAQQAALPVVLLDEEVRGAVRAAQLRLEPVRDHPRGRRLDGPRGRQWVVQFPREGRGHQSRQGRVHRVEDEQARAAQQPVDQAGEHVGVTAARLRGPVEAGADGGDVLGGTVEGVQQRVYLRRPPGVPGHAAHRDALGDVQGQAVQALAGVQQGRARHLGGVVVLAGDPVHRDDRGVLGVQLPRQQRRVRALVHRVRRAGQGARLLSGDDHAGRRVRQPGQSGLDGRGQGAQVAVVGAQRVREGHAVNVGPGLGLRGLQRPCGQAHVVQQPTVPVFRPCVSRHSPSFPVPAARVGPAPDADSRRRAHPFSLRIRPGTATGVTLHQNLKQRGTAPPAHHGPPLPHAPEGQRSGSCVARSSPARSVRMIRRYPRSSSPRDRKSPSSFVIVSRVLPTTCARS